MRKIRTGDKVIVIAGDDKGVVGIVKKIIPNLQRVVVEGCKKLVCFNKKTKSGISTKEGTMHISNVAHIDPDSQESTRVGIIVENNKKTLVSKKSGKKVR